MVQAGNGPGFALEALRGATRARRQATLGYLAPDFRGEQPSVGEDVIDAPSDPVVDSNASTA
jgi:hypothetical protein